MALCSQPLTSSKRPHGYPHLSPQGSGIPSAKRICLTKMNISSGVAGKYVSCFDLPSSSESDVDSDDQQSCYIADQIRAKRRASSRVSFCLDDKVSKAMSQYSDDDLPESISRIGHSRTSSIVKPEDEDLDCTFMCSPPSSSNLRLYINSTVSNVNNNINVDHVGLRSSSHGSFLHISDSCSSSASVKRTIPAGDKQARSKCFDYLIGAIDEAWASYCNAASYAEDETYGYNTPASVVTDDEDYCGNTTDLTDYESDYEQKSSFHLRREQSQQTHQFGAVSRKPSIFGMSPSSDMSSAGQDPSSCRLQALKERLIKAKYYLQDLVDSDDYNDALNFWKRWDMIKYATIELVEDDDDDTVMESTIDELEHGRHFSN